MDPIFTIATGSLFILEVMEHEFRASDGLLFKVKDYDRTSKSDDLGYVQVSGKDLCEANGQRMTLKLTPPEGRELSEAGVLNLRCRPMTAYDKKFLAYATGNAGSDDLFGIDKNLDIIMNPRSGTRKLLNERMSMTGAFNRLLQRMRLYAFSPKSVSLNLCRENGPR